VVTSERRHGGRPDARASTDPAVLAGEQLGSYPESRVSNSQPEGIGRVVVVGELCAWNNLGRNVVFASRACRPLAIFDQTRFPDDDELSQYDLDVHAILEIPGPDVIVVLNHLGLLRAFRRSEIRVLPGCVDRLDPLWTCRFVEDVERVVIVGDRLVGSRPREQHAGGLLVSEPIRAASGPVRIDVDVELEHWGVITALGSLFTGGQDWVAIGGNGRVGLIPAPNGALGQPRWDVEVDFEPAVFIWGDGLLWVAGPALGGAGIGDYEWERLGGGGFAGLDLRDGSSVLGGRFAHDLAWGNGGAAVVMIGGLVCGIGRTGELCVFSARDGTCLMRTAPLASHSLGIAHAAVVGDHIVYGFNRGGYRLHRLAVSTIASLTRD
jgi:hypothetical protein